MAIGTLHITITDASAMILEPGVTTLYMDVYEQAMLQLSAISPNDLPSSLAQILGHSTVQLDPKLLVPCSRCYGLIDPQSFSTS